MYSKLAFIEYKEINQLTDCLKPCKYRKYFFFGDPIETVFESEYFTFSLWAVSKETRIKKEHLIYPLSSLIAEFGGTLGIFLGFSFITLWDNIILTSAFSIYKLYQLSRKH